MTSRFGHYLRLFSWTDLVRIKSATRVRDRYDHPSHRRARALREFVDYVPPERIRRADGLYRFTWPVAGVDRRFALREGTSDIEVFLQVIRDQEYRDPARMLRPWPGIAPRIVDAGANVGLTTLYLKSVLPDARVVALEPAPGNVAALERCMAENSLENVDAVAGALWTGRGALELSHDFRDGRSWSTSVRARDGSADADAGATHIAGVEALTLADVLDRAGWDEVDLLKVDVEGAEARLIRDAPTMEVVRRRVRLLCMEVHEEVISRAEVEAALEAAGFRSVTAGETLIAWPERAPSTHA